MLHTPSLCHCEALKAIIMTTLLSTTDIELVPAEEASLQSLPYVTLIYSTFRDAITSRPVLNPSHYVGAQPMCAFVHDQLLLSEESPLWNHPSHGDQLYVVRLGIARSLGLSLDDVDVDVPNAVIVDLLVEALAFAVSRSFSDLQTQQWLLALHETHKDIVEIKFNIGEGAEGLVYDEDELEGPVARRLTKRLQTLTTKSPTPCIEKRVTTEVTTEEKPDPVALAAVEAKKDTKGNKKLQAAYEEALRNVPKIRVDVVTEKVVDIEVVVDIGPVFSFDDVAQMCSFMSDTLLMHWRLYRYVAVIERKYDVKSITVGVNDVSAFVLPPLNSALVDREYQMACDRQALLDEAISAIDHAFEELFVRPMQSAEVILHTSFKSVMEKMQEKERLDREAALPRDEFTRAVEVLTRRVTKKVLHNQPHVPRPTSATAKAASRPPSAGAHHEGKMSKAPAGIKGGPSPSHGKAPAAAPTDAAAAVSLVPPHTPPLQSAEEFDYAQVEAKLEALSETVARLMAPPVAAAPGGKKK